MCGGRARAYCCSRSQAGKCEQRSAFLDQFEMRLARIRDRYEWGDMERDKYLHERDASTAEAATHQSADGLAGVCVVDRVARFLADRPRHGKRRRRSSVTISRG